MLLSLRLFPRIRIWERNERCLHWSQDLVTVSNSVKTPIQSAVLSGALSFRNYRTASKEWMLWSTHFSPPSLLVRAHNEGQKIDTLASNTAKINCRAQIQGGRGWQNGWEVIMEKRESWQEQPPWFSSSISRVDWQINHWRTRNKEQSLSYILIADSLPFPISTFFPCPRPY